MRQTASTRKQPIGGFKKTRAIRRLRKMKRRIRVIPGGTSAGKTYGILPILIQRAIKTDGIEISVVSESMPHLRKGAIKDFKKIMKQTGRWKRSHWHETNSIYTFHNGSTIEFFSVDDESKVRGPRRNVLYVNEANNIKFDTYYQLLIRTDREVYIDYNPTHQFWVHDEVIGNRNVEVLKLTYKDNDALSQNIVDELESNLDKAFYNPKAPWDEMFKETNIKSAYWANWCKVYLFGEVGTLEGAIFNDWEIVTTLPPEARLVGYGLDFGYSNNPSALVAAYQYNGKYYFKELFYRKGLKSNDMSELMEQLGVRRDVTIWCDSADPRMKDELWEYGWDIAGAIKGADSVVFGIDQLQKEKFFVTADSLNMIKELRSYVWDTDKKSGRTLNKPVKAFDHLMDAFRYFAVMNLSLILGYDDDDDVDYIN